jgi:sulfopyruvate decarboxylase subunit beta
MVSESRPSRAVYYKVLAKALSPDALVVTALGNASYLWAAIRHTPENFYIEDSMGLALPLALGLAVAQPKRRVIVVEGDGATLMHLGALVTVGAVAPDNLTVLLIQNGIHAASGGQVLTNPNLDLAQLARAAGIARAQNVATAEAFASVLALANTGPQVIVLSTTPDIDVVKPPVAFDPVVTKNRFMTAIGTPRYIPTLFGGGRFERD